ncbi:nuclear transport factor 2 family protein [Erythrobacter alti]|uniref:nuclear transport factor 2 family protein n=1 Tax=Erythrobacter alti TaxID=1896145 RepID=UPI0030F41F38
MTNPAIDIPNLLFRYADLMDAGALADAAHLFDHGAIMAQGKEIVGAEQIEAYWRSFVIVHENGGLKTRHLTTNPQICLSDDGQIAQCVSQWTILQQTEGLALQIIGSGRYSDEFALVDNVWRFTRREYASVDFWGDTSQHLKTKTKELEN